MSSTTTTRSGDEGHVMAEESFLLGSERWNLVEIGGPDGWIVYIRSLENTQVPCVEVSFGVGPGSLSFSIKLDAEDAIAVAGGLLELAQMAREDFRARASAEGIDPVKRSEREGDE